VTDGPDDTEPDAPGGEWLDSIGGPDTGAFPKPGESKKVTAEDPNRYTMRGEVGRGGIGRVLLGFDEHIGRDVAIKELLPERASSSSGSGSSTAFIDRFLREARVTGQLEHPHIVPVYELGRHADGTLYYAMKVVRGKTLAAALADSESLDERLGLLGHFASACQAIAYAHSRGVIHRDLKPENIMLDEFGETVVLDWGLAKVRGKEDLRQQQIQHEVEVLADSKGGSTVDGYAIGTPSYMAPEQADGNVVEIDERSDVWGLGAVLYELLTGRPPFVGETAYEIIGQVVSAPLIPVGDVEGDAPRELAAVAEKALQRDKDDRYLSAAELAGEIEAFRSGARVEAHRYSAWELMRRLATQNRAATGVAAIGLAILLIVFVVAYGRIMDERDQAVAARGRAQKHLAQALAEKARSAARDRDWIGATVYGAAALERDELAEVRGILTAVEAWRPELVWQKRSGNACAAVVISPDGNRVACPTLLGMPIWDVTTGVESARINTGGGWLTAAAYSADGAWIAAPSHDKSVRLWRLGKDGAPEFELRGRGHTIAPRAIAFSPDGSLLASTGEDKTIRLWALPDATSPSDQLVEARVLTGPRESITTVVFAGGRVMAGDRGGRVHTWDVGTGRLVGTGVAHGAAVRDLHVSLDGTRVASAGEDGIVNLWGLNHETPLGVLIGHEGPVLTVRFGADGETLYTGGSDGTLRVWSARTHELLGRFDAHIGELHSLVVSSDGSHLVTTGEDKTVRAWRGAAVTATELSGAPVAVEALVHSPDGEVVVAGCADHQIRIWDVSAGRLATTLPTHAEDSVAAIAFHPTEQSFISAGHDGKLHMWKVAQAETGPLWLRASPFPQLSGRARAVAFSPDGSLVAAAGDDRVVHLWDLSRDGEHIRLRGHGDIITSLAFSSDGSQLATGSWDRSVRLWDVAGRSQAEVLQAHEKSVLDVAFAKGRRLMSVGSQVRLWELGVASSTVLEGHEDVVHAVDCSLDAPWCATASADGTVRIWDVSTREARAVVDTLASKPMAMAFSPDGSGLTVGTANGAIVLLQLAPLSLAREGLLAETEVRYGLSLRGMRVTPNPD